MKSKRKYMHEHGIQPPDKGRTIWDYCPEIGQVGGTPKFSSRGSPAQGRFFVAGKQESGIENILENFPEAENLAKFRKLISKRAEFPPHKAGFSLLESKNLASEENLEVFQWEDKFSKYLLPQGG